MEDQIKGLSVSRPEAYAIRGAVQKHHSQQLALFCWIPPNYREAGPTYHYCNFSMNHHHMRFEMVKMIGEGRAAKWLVKDSFEMKGNSR
ncbi:MAG TPA: hypothetical protein VGQ94_00055 [Terriglobales bacterium]|nr:hypothetical protein [Terriglobales bacterium]